MKLENIKLHSFLKDKNINFLYHANSVSTSITYFEQNGLLSRGAIEGLKLHQSEQSSDILDKKFNVWNDVFIDTIDLHGYFPRQNLYGPISFELNVDLILNENYEIWITKNNPIYWKEGQLDKDKYFINLEDLETNWDKIERHRKMVTIKNNTNPILFDYINKIIIDDPRIKITESNVIVFNEAKKAINAILESKLHLKNKIITRVCNNCYCRDNYLRQVSSADLKRLFLPNL